jgi:hypothetical protein
MKADLLLATLVLSLMAFFVLSEPVTTCPTTFAYDWIGKSIASSIALISGWVVGCHLMEGVIIPGIEALARLANRWRSS